jgi:hypothetical protein
MNFPQVVAQMQDLPASFKKTSQPYTSVIDALSTQLVDYTYGADNIAAQLSFSDARYGWLDCWGLIFGLPRNANESDFNYSSRIVAVLNAVVGTVPALTLWLEYCFGPGGIVKENTPNLGYSITLPPSYSQQQLTLFLTTFNRIRPAGVPFMFGSITNGTFIRTLNFTGGAPSVIGAYLGAVTNTVTAPIGASQPSAIPSLPDLYLTDPTLNPSLA